MKIAIYTPTFKENQDGVARSTYRLVDTLLQQGHEVIVSSPLITPQKRNNLILNKIDSSPLSFYPQYSIAHFKLQYYDQLYRFKPDIIQIATPDIVGLATLWWARKNKIPVVFIHHSDIVRLFKSYGLNFMTPFILHFLRIVYNNSSKVFAPTQEVRRELMVNGIKRVSIWSRGVDQDKFNPKWRSNSLRKKWGFLDKKVITFVGRMAKEKNISRIVEVYQKYSKLPQQKIGFLMIGDGPLLKKLKSQMPEAIFTGFLKNEELWQAFASGDIFLFPSNFDTFGQVIQESLASGLPVIVSNVGGCQEIVQNSKAGIIVHSNTCNAFFKACHILLNNEDLYYKMRFNGKFYVQNRTWEKINSDLIRIYEHHVLNASRHIEKIKFMFWIFDFFFSSKRTTMINPLSN